MDKRICKYFAFEVPGKAEFLALLELTKIKPRALIDSKDFEEAMQ